MRYLLSLRFTFSREQKMSRRVRRSIRAKAICAAAASMLFSYFSDVQTFNWIEGSGSWSQAGKWVGGSVPPSSQSTALRFSGSNAFASTNNIGAYSLDRILLENSGSQPISVNAATVQ